MEAAPRIGLLWRREWDPPSAEPPKLHGVFAAFRELGVEAESVVYSDDAVEAVHEQLLQLDAVLVWVNPVEQGLDRSKLNPLLGAVADAGVFVSAHPDGDRVVGFTQQYPRGLVAPGTELPPSAKVFEPPDAPDFRDLRERAEAEWVPEMQRILGLETAQLPVIWDLDFLYGPKDASGKDTYVLCEINVSSTFAFPEVAMPGVARATLERIRDR